MRYALLFVILLAPLAEATVLIDAQTGSEITAGFVRIEGATATEYLIEPGQPAVLPNQTAHELLVLVRENASETYEYYARIPPGEVPPALILHPAGLLLGELRDATDNLIIHTPLVVDCPSRQVAVETDGTGRFRTFLPAESCVITSAAQGKAGSLDIVIEQGVVLQTTMTINQSVSAPPAPEESLHWSFYVFALLMVLAVAAYFTTKRSDLPGDEVPKPAKKRFAIEHHLDALRPKERMIADQLIVQDGKATIASLKSATRIPRTSLLRTLEGLEQRGLLLKIDDNGKKSVELIKK